MCVRVCLLEPLQRQSESQSRNNLVVQFLPVDLGFLNLRQLWEKTLWSWCLAHVFSSGWRASAESGSWSLQKIKGCVKLFVRTQQGHDKATGFWSFTFLIQSDPSLSGGFPHFSLCSHRQFDPSPMVCVCTVYRICTQRGFDYLIHFMEWACPWAKLHAPSRVMESQLWILHSSLAITIAHLYVPHCKLHPEPGLRRCQHPRISQVVIRKH